MKGSRIGSLIGACGGLAFVIANSADFPGPVRVTVLVTGAVLFAAVLWLAVIRAPEAVEAGTPPSRAAIRTYGFSVTGMVVAIFAGSSVIGRVLDRPDLVVLWVVFVVGAHFLPFSKAFHAPVFSRLAWTLMGLAAAGAVATLTVDTIMAKWTAVAAGMALMLFSLLGPRFRAAR